MISHLLGAARCCFSLPCSHCSFPSGPRCLSEPWCRAQSPPPLSSHRMDGVDSRLSPHNPAAPGAPRVGTADFPPEARSGVRACSELLFSPCPTLATGLAPHGSTSLTWVLSSHSDHTPGSFLPRFCTLQTWMLNPLSCPQHAIHPSTAVFRAATRKSSGPTLPY